VVFKQEHQRQNQSKAAAFLIMDSSIGIRRSHQSSYERLLAIIFTILAVISPLYIDQQSSTELEEEDEAFSLSLLLPILLLIVILAIIISGYMDQNRFDPYWIHRVGGSSGGILLILTILILVLKCKS
jgi:cell division protein FtsW (lipid II flippase)